MTDFMLVDENTVFVDMGCGVGPVAIVAAMRGAKEVYAVDIVEKHCEYTQYNAKLNGVGDRVKVLQGDLFEPVQGKTFDVIVDDVSGMAERISRISPWYPDAIPTGGQDGTEPTLRMMEQSTEYLSRNGKLYFPVLSLANSPKILERAKEIYGSGLKQLCEKFIPFCPDFKRQLTDLEEMKKKGLIDYVTRRSRHLWILRVFEASPKLA